jgi:RNA polymerase sigma-70 factor, ECF subfamily
MTKKSQAKKLFYRIKKKDRNAFIEAYDAYADDIYRFAFFKMGSSEEAKDLVSAAFLKVWNYAQSNSLDESRSLRAFIYKTARNLIIDHYRQLRESGASLDDERNNLKNVLADERQNPALQAEIFSDMEDVMAGLDKLKDEYREMILMHFVDELSFGEIAEVTGKSVGSVRVQTFRALQALKEVLNEDKK